MTLPVPAPSTTETALRQLLERGEGRLRAFVGDLCRGGRSRPGSGRCDPDDVVQEAMARAWRYRESLDPNQDGLPWLLRIAFRVYLDQRAARPRPTTLEDAPEPPCPAPGAERTANGRDAVQALLADLKPIERAVLVGFHRDGDSLRDLATRHRLPVNTIKSHLHRARRTLRDKGDPS